MMVVGAILVLFALGLGVVIGTTSFNNLTRVKQSELERTSQILASRILDMEQNAALAVRSFEENEPIVAEIKLLTDLGPYYADPGSYFADDFMGNGGSIEEADQIYVFQAQLRLVQLLQPVQRVNNLSSVSFYLLSPYGIVSEAEPALAFRLDPEEIYVSQFTHKGDAGNRVIYRVPTDEFTPPPSDYFDISSAYSASPDQFYVENGFEPAGNSAEVGLFPHSWQETDTPRSQVILKAGIPVIQTWYPVKVPIAHPETWDEETVPVGLAMVEQRLDAPAVALLEKQLGLDVGFAQDDRLLITSLDPSASAADLATLAESQTLVFEQDEFYYAQKEIDFSSSGPANLEAVILSPVSELEQLTRILGLQIGLVTVVAVLLTSVIVYVSFQYLVSRPLYSLMRGVELISAGDLTQKVIIQSRDELGRLATTFNAMTDQLKELYGTLEERVADRTRRLEMIASLSEHLSAILNLEELLAELVNLVKDSFGYYHVHIYLVDEAQEKLVMAEGTGRAGVEMKAQGHSIPLKATKSLVARSARSGEIVSISNVREEDDWLPQPLLPDTYSELAVPIILEGRVVGVLDVQENKIAGLDEGDANLLRSLANQVAVAIRNARLFAKVETALAEAHAVQQRYVEQSWEKTKIISRGGQYYYVAPDAPPLDEAKQQMMAEVKRVAATKDYPTVIAVDDVDNDKAQSPNTIVTSINLRGKTIGVLHLHPGSHDRKWSYGDLTMIDTVVNQLTQAAENLRLFEEARERAERERTIREITDKLRAASSLDSLLETAARELGQRLGIPHTVLELGIESKPQISATSSDLSENGQ